MTRSLAAPDTMRRFATWWTIGSVVVGIATSVAIYELRSAGTALDRAGSALVTTGRALSGFDDLPLVGNDIGETGDRITEQGERATAIADDTRRRIAIVAITAGLLVTVLGAAPMLVISRVVRDLHGSPSQSDRAAS